jgi:ABC-type multidrug transport system fused ATPase/permease subunit
MRYKDFIKNNSSTLTKTIVSEASSLTMMINAYLMILSESVVLIMIYSMMIYVNVEITLVITAFLGINAILLTKVITKKVKKQGKIRENTQRDFYKIINKSFGDFKFIKLQNSDQKIMQEFSTVSSDYSQSNIKYTTLSHFPRLFLEAVGFSMIIFMIVFYIWQKEIDIKEILPTITMFVLALYRLMPSANRIMTAYNQINFQYKALDIIHNDLMYDVESLGDERVEFKEKIYLKDICFGYDSDKLLFQGFDIEIKKGDKVAFIGESGSGKSTLVDILMGLHKPLDGDIYIDDNKLTDENVKDWKSKIGYIPQAVYLFDGTVADNIVFGREYDEGRLVDVLKKANIYHFLMEKDGLDTLVGENGVMLSGGQKQRIAIARALYDNPDILVLDEATSALDDDTESKIMDEIYNSSTNKTLIIIAHRLSTIDRCNVVYKLDKGKIVQ